MDLVLKFNLPSALIAGDEYTIPQIDMFSKAEIRMGKAGARCHESMWYETR